MPYYSIEKGVSIVTLEIRYVNYEEIEIYNFLNTPD